MTADDTYRKKVLRVMDADDANVEKIRSHIKASIARSNAMSADEYMYGGNHYKNMSVEPWNVIDSWSLEQRVGYYRGCALKYVMRLGTKDASVQEARKAKHYLEKLIEVYDDCDSEAQSACPPTA